jgi:hypothetical protein
MRTTIPGDLSTFVTGAMLGVNEESVTYPQFVHDIATNKLMFFYRNGSSGYGNTYLRRLDDSTWVNPIAGALINAQATSESAYLQHISSDGNGLHLFFCWRGIPRVRRQRQNPDRARLVVDGTTWQHELVTKLTHRMETVNQGLITVAVARPSVVAAQDGRVYVIYRTLHDNRRGTVRCVDVTPGATDRRDFSVCNIDGGDQRRDCQAPRHADADFRGTSA